MSIPIVKLLYDGELKKSIFTVKKRKIIILIIFIKSQFRRIIYIIVSYILGNWTKKN